MPDSNPFRCSSNQLVINFIITICYLNQLTTNVPLLPLVPFAHPSLSLIRPICPSFPFAYPSHLPILPFRLSVPSVSSVPFAYPSHLSHPSHPSHLPHTPSELFRSFRTIFYSFLRFFIHSPTISAIEINKQIRKPFKYRISI